MTDSVGPSLAVRAAEMDEVPRILELVAHSRSIMRANGNDVQWDGYPGADLIGSDISKGIGHVVTLDGVNLPTLISRKASGWTTPPPTAPSTGWPVPRGCTALPSALLHGAKPNAPR